MVARNLRDAIIASSYESKMPHHSKAVVPAYVAYSEELYKDQIATIPQEKLATFMYHPANRKGKKYEAAARPGEPYGAQFARKLGFSLVVVELETKNIEECFARVSGLRDQVPLELGRRVRAVSSAACRFWAWAVVHAHQYHQGRARTRLREEVSRSWTRSFRDQHSWHNVNTTG